MIIEVRPVEKTPWHGKKGKESFKSPLTLYCLVNPETVSYDSGLTKEEVEKYQEALGVDLSSTFIRDQAHSFWDSNMGKIKLENRTNIFDTNKPLDAIKVSVLKQSKYVANSLLEFDQGLYPDAEFIIYDEKEEVEVKATKLAIKREAIVKSMELTDNQKAQIVLLISGKLVKGKSKDFIDVELDKLIDNNAKMVLKYISRSKEEVSTEALVREAVQKSILKQAGHKIMYHDSVLGTEIADVALYLNRPENQDLKLRIMESVNN